MTKEHCDDELCPVFKHSQKLSSTNYDGYDNMLYQNMNLLSSNLTTLKTHLDHIIKDLPYLSNIYVNYGDLESKNFSLRSDNEKSIKKNYIVIKDEAFPLECMYCSKFKKFDVSEKIRSESAIDVLSEK